MKYTYLLIDLLSLLFPLLFSFHPKLKFYRNWPAFFPAVLISGCLFIAWDMYFTKLKVWGFNPSYIMGVSVGNLPVEEILFFFCIPYACVFTYASVPLQGFSKNKEIVSSAILTGISVLLAVMFRHRFYTASAFSVLAVLIFFAQFLLKVAWLSRFYQIYIILLLPFLLVNGLLTGTGLAAPVVWYNAKEMFNIRLLTIPVEDIFYGMGLVLMNLLIYNRILEGRYLRSREHKKENLATI